MPLASLHRWEDLPLEKVTDLVSKKIVTGERQMIVQVYLKKGALIPLHEHDSEQMTYVLQGALRYAVDGRTITVSEGEVLLIPAGARHQAEALEDTFEMDLFSPPRSGWVPVDEAVELGQAPTVPTKAR